jgi:hypothetical protein
MEVHKYSLIKQYRPRIPAVDIPILYYGYTLSELFHQSKIPRATLRSALQRAKFNAHFSVYSAIIYKNNDVYYTLHKFVPRTVVGSPTSVHPPGPHWFCSIAP